MHRYPTLVPKDMILLKCIDPQVRHSQMIGTCKPLFFSWLGTGPYEWCFASRYNVIFACSMIFFAVWKTPLDGRQTPVHSDKVTVERWCYSCVPLSARVSVWPDEKRKPTELQGKRRNFGLLAAAWATVCQTYDIDHRIHMLRLEPVSSSSDQWQPFLVSAHRLVAIARLCSC